MNKTKLTALSLFTYLSLLIVSPLFGWHIHHACAEGTHGFESHFSHTANHEHHGNECQSENLYQHAFEQGSVLANATAVDYAQVYFFVAPPAQVDFLPHFKQDIAELTPINCDIGPPKYYLSSFSLRAPPTLSA